MKLFVAVMGAPPNNILPNQQIADWIGALTAASGHRSIVEAHLAGCWRASIAIRRQRRARRRQCEYRATIGCGHCLSRLPWRGEYRAATECGRHLSRLPR